MSHVFVICEVERITVQLVTQGYKLIQHTKVLEIPWNNNNKIKRYGKMGLFPIFANAESVSAFTVMVKSP